MNIASAVVVYILIWWCVFIVVLPMGVKSVWEADGEAGGAADKRPSTSDATAPRYADPGAPQNPNLKRKAVTTTWVSAILWAVACAVIISGATNFKE